MPDDESSIAVRADFVADWTAHTRRALAAAGYAGPFTDSEVAFAWFNLQNRGINARPRRTVLAREFQCPPELSQAVADLISKSETGCSLIGYLSKKIAFDALYTDGLLNDWQVHHFHVGESLESSGFVKRTRNLLFALVSPDTLYVLRVGDHEEFSSVDLFACLARNWPELVEQRRVPADEVGQRAISDTERGQLRKGGAYAATVIDDGAYIPAGLGVVMSGTSVKVIVQVQQLYHFLQSLEAYTRARAHEFADQIRRAGHPISAELTLALCFGSDQLVARHSETGTTFDISRALG